MPRGPHNDNATYPNWMGFIFIFNLIVGTGALTLPHVFAKAGWLLSLMLIIVLAFISYMTVTFIIEAIACANAVKNWQHLQLENEHENDSIDTDLPARQSSLRESASNVSDYENTEITERIPLCEPRARAFYKLDKKFELGEMASIFFNDIGCILFYFCIALYLYGDLSIYSAAVAKSLRDITCKNENGTGLHVSIYWIGADNNTNSACWENSTITRLTMYRLLLFGFTVTFGALTFFSLQKTKTLQMITIVFRWLAFTFMIGIALKLLLVNGAIGHPPAANIYGLPSLFGACVYSFMCHHSIPSLLTPIHNKSKLRSLISYDYISICTVYILLAMTGIFAFDHLKDLYTLNFMPSQAYAPSFKAEVIILIDYFLALFPVFTLSASYPIIAITLRNNLQILFLDMTRFEAYNLFIRRILFPICAIVPPFIITFFTESLTSLIVFTGSYAGVGIQYIIPVALIYLARGTCKELLGAGIVNEYRSQFQNSIWLLLVLIWALGAVCLVTINFFY